MRTLASLLTLMLTLALSGQEVQSFKQHDMKKWGIPAGNYSGITHIEGNRFALVSDKQEANGWTEVSISFLPSGDIDRMQFIRHHYEAKTQGKVRDSEGIAYVPGQGFFVSAENDQQILELSEEGTPTSRSLSVPTPFRRTNIFSNCGFESLAYNANQGILWTTTEQGLKSDVKAQSTYSSRTPTLLRIQSFDSDLQPLEQFAYSTEAPATTLKPKHYAFGVSELLALNDSTLIVMERELNIPEQYNRAQCIIRLFCISPSPERAIADTSVPLNKMSKSSFLPKKHLYSFHTDIRLLGRKDFANYEGMCLGPKLADGSQTLLLISDSQNRAGNSFFRLKDYIKVLVIKP